MENPIAQNRAEELGYDLWEDFVVPPFYDSLELLSAKKPRVIVGGRGCGKTSLLRYLCHQSQFSIRRQAISSNDLTHIGIYWKIDTQFAKILTKRGFDEQVWERAFEHMSVLIMAQEVLKSLESIAYSKIKDFDQGDLHSFDFNILSSFNPNTPADYTALKRFLRTEFNFFQSWVGNIRQLKQPIFLPKSFLIELITEIKSQNKLFKNSNYFVYIDEYENLISDQQHLINTWLKHSEMPLIFNLAMKRNSFEDKSTVGNEQLAEIHDYRPYDLESYYENVSFEVFAAEILFLRLWKNDSTLKIPINPDELRSSDNAILSKRRSGEYRKRIIASAKAFLPKPSIEDIGVEIFSDPILSNRLQLLIADSVNQKGIKIEPKNLYLNDYPLASLIIPALISRGIKATELISEVEKLKKGKENKFTGKTNWIHNYAVGCILLIYEPLGRFCPFYAGFEAFCLMSKTNLRHFLELCFKSIVNETLNSQTSKPVAISTKSQADAAKQASTSFLKEVKSFGNNGNILHTFVLRLGTYFKYSHKRLAQSEPEQNHFGIKGMTNDRVDKFISEALKWSVLYENPITKQKGGAAKLEVENFEYVLNPIYAPYFHISYRKKRRIDFDLSTLETLIFGDFNKFDGFLKQTLKEWNISLQEANLFSDTEY